jgi:hypothetical protein
MRQLRFEKSFDEAVEALGGYQAIDEALESVIDGLLRNPQGFDCVNNEWVCVRYAITKRVAVAAHVIPPLVVVFSILENGDVSLNPERRQSQRDDRNGT